MNPFAIDPLEEQNQIANAALNPGEVYDGPGVFDGALTALPRGLASGYYRDVYSLSEQSKDVPAMERTYKKLQNVQPKPDEFGIAAQIIFGVSEPIAQSISSLSSGNVTPSLISMDVGTSYARSRKRQLMEQNPNLDEKTAQDQANTEGMFTGLGLVAPVSTAGGFATRALSGAAINFGLGAAERALISKTLMDNGYKDMAEQYQVFDAAQGLTDIALGGLLGGAFGERAQVKPKPKLKVKPSDIDAILSLNNAGHIESSGPGIPVDDATREAHVQSVEKALQDLMFDNPVDVSPTFKSDSMIVDPTKTQHAQSVRAAVEDHLNMNIEDINIQETSPATLERLKKIQDLEEENRALRSSAFDGDSNLTDAERLANLEKSKEIEAQIAELRKVRDEANRLPPQVNNAVLGNPSSIKVGRDYLPVRWALVDAGDVEATMTKADNQYRDRTRASSQAQIAEIANAPDYNLLNAAPVMDFGAPTLTRDGKIVGGNGRMAGISAAYDQGTNRSYSEPLLANLDKYGIDPKTAEGMKKPVLVRILETDVDVKKAAIASNEGAGLGMSDLEQAKVDAERMGNAAGLSIDADGNFNTMANMDLIRNMVAQFPITEQGKFVDADGRLSAAGVRRVRNAILYKAYGDSPTLARLVESQDPGAKNVANALLRTAPLVAEVKDGIAAGRYYPLDIATDIASAVETLDRIRGQNLKVADYLNQSEMFANELTIEARKVLEFMGEYIRSSKTMGDMITSYYESVKNAGDPAQIDMLRSEPPTKGELLDAAIAKTGKDFVAELAELPLATKPAEDNSLKYPIAPKDEWYGEGTYEQDGGKLVVVSPDEYLAKVKPLTMDEESRENIDLLKEHILSGKTLDPVLIRKNGKEDGRHRAHAAKELGIKEIPVIDYGDNFPNAEKFGAAAEADKNAIEQRFMDRVNNDYKTLVKEYENLPDSDGGKIIDTDVARELAPEYITDRTLAPTVHEPASTFVKKLYADKLSKPTPKGSAPVVLFTAGGTGAGKSSGRGLLGPDLNSAEIVYDSTMSSFASADKKIQQALEAGRTAVIMYVYRDPVDALVNGALKRATSQEKQFGSGRTTKIKDFAEMHAGSRKTIVELAEKYKDDQRVKVIIIDNSKGSKPEFSSIAKLPEMTYNDVERSLYEALRTERESGKISESIYRGFNDQVQSGRMGSESSPGVSEQSYSGSERQQSEIGQLDQPTNPDQLPKSDMFSAQAIVQERPDLIIVDANGDRVLARDAIAQADENIATAERESIAFNVAAECALVE